MFETETKKVNGLLEKNGYIIMDLKDTMADGMWLATKQPDIRFVYVIVGSRRNLRDTIYVDIPEMVIAPVIETFKNKKVPCNVFVADKTEEPEIYFTDVKTIVTVGKPKQCDITGIKMFRMSITRDTNHPIYRSSGFLFDKTMISPKYSPTPLDPTSASVYGEPIPGFKNLI